MSTEIGTLLVSSPEICNGHLRIDGTRITVNQIVFLYKQGHTADQIADDYPDLTMAQVYAALAYYHANQEEIEADIEAEKKETNDTNGLTSSVEKEIWLEAFKTLQRNLSLTPTTAAEWQKTIHDARR